MQMCWHTFLLVHLLITAHFGGVVEQQRGERDHNLPFACLLTRARPRSRQDPNLRRSHW